MNWKFGDEQLSNATVREGAETLQRNALVILVGPPVRREDDEDVVDKLLSTPGRRVVCGGTTSNIVARQLGREIQVDLETATEVVPPAGRIEEIDLVTEGTLTLTEALKIVRSQTPMEELKGRIDGASRLVVLLGEAEEICLLVGRASNPVHQNPDLEKNLGVKSQVIHDLGEELRQSGKEVHCEYF